MCSHKRTKSLISRAHSALRRSFRATGPVAAAAFAEPLRKRFGVLSELAICDHYTKILQLIDDPTLSEITSLNTPTSLRQPAPA